MRLRISIIILFVSIFGVVAGCGTSSRESVSSPKSITPEASYVIPVAGKPQVTQEQLDEYMNRIGTLGERMNSAERAINSCFAEDGPILTPASVAVIEDSMTIVNDELDEWAGSLAPIEHLGPMHQAMLEYMHLFRDSLEHLRKGFVEANAAEMGQWAILMEQAYDAKKRAWAEVEQLYEKYGADD